MSERRLEGDPAFRRVAIVNRGEAAVRLIRAVRELNLEHGWGIRTIALHTELERRATFVREADDAVAIDGERPYLDHGELERALRAGGADAAWVGWGFVAEDPGFADLCARIGVVFIGPPPDVIRRVGDKIAAQLLAEQMGRPVAARQITGARHIEVQIIADHHGVVWAPGVRDCSIQRAHQKLINESGSPALDVEQEREVRVAAMKLARSVGFRSAGTVRYLYRPHERAFALVGFDVCLQADHLVTEATTGLDLVKLQLHIAAGGRLEHEPPIASGHAIEARLNAEDPERGFAHAPVTVEHLMLASGPGVRVDTGLAEGDVISAEHDSTLAKVVGWGQTRAEARARLRRALAGTSAVVRGGTTTKALLIDVLDRPEMIAATADTGWLDRVIASDGHILTRHADVALLASAIDMYDSEQVLERRGFYAGASRGRPKASHEIGRTFDLRHRGHTYRLAVAQTGPRWYKIEVDGATVDVQAEPPRRITRRLAIGGRTFAIESVTDGLDYLMEVEGVAHRVSRNEGVIVRAPSPALVVAVTVAAGDEVEAGSLVAVLESMKMEMTVVATHAGRVREVLVAGSTHVEAGAPLLSIEPWRSEEVEVLGASRIAFGGWDAAADRGARARALDYLVALRSLIMGFDVGVGESRRLVSEFQRARNELPADDSELLHGELGILTIFADLAELSRNWAAGESEDFDAEPDERVRSPREHFWSYLRSLDVGREGLPETFAARLARALAHYGVDQLERGPELEEAVYRTFLAHERAASQAPAVMALLDHRLQHAEALSGPLREQFHETLDRLIVAAQLRYPVVGELARSVRFRVFDRPVIEDARVRVLAAAREQLSYLAAHPDAPDHAERVETLVASPEPLIRLLAERIGGREGDGPLLELLTRRYYKIVPLERVHSQCLDGRQFLTTHYSLGGQRIRLIATLAEALELPVAASAVAALAPDDSAQESVADFYLHWSEPLPDAEKMAAGLGAQLNRVQLPSSVRRVAVAVGTQPDTGVRHFTFRLSDGAFQEECVTRGLHPMIARRPASVATGQLRAHARPVGRRRTPVSLRRPREPV
jgi:acetyl/propionyl-CoA carboxylase alpha subunit